MDTAIETAVCMPWRATPERLPIYKRVRKFWEDGGYRVVTADSNPKNPFNLSEARNNAVRKANTDVAIIADADTIPDLHAVGRGVRLAYRSAMVVFPFQRYHYTGIIDPETADLENLPTERIYHGSFGGLAIARSVIYWKIGGYDPGFRQWGYEDNAFEAAADCLIGVRRIDADVWAFGHDAPRDLGPDNPGWARARLYSYARRDRRIMEELIRRCL